MGQVPFWNVLGPGGSCSHCERPQGTGAGLGSSSSRVRVPWAGWPGPEVRPLFPCGPHISRVQHGWWHPRDTAYVQHTFPLMPLRAVHCAEGRVYPCAHVCAFVCARVFVCACVHPCVWTCVPVCACVLVCVSVCVCAWVCVCLSVHVPVCGGCSPFPRGEGVATWMSSTLALEMRGRMQGSERPGSGKALS